VQNLGFTACATRSAGSSALGGAHGAGACDVLHGQARRLLRRGGGLRGATGRARSARCYSRRGCEGRRGPPAGIVHAALAACAAKLADQTRAQQWRHPQQAVLQVQVQQAVLQGALPAAGATAVHVPAARAWPHTQPGLRGRRPSGGPCRPSQPRRLLHRALRAAPVPLRRFPPRLSRRQACPRSRPQAPAPCAPPSGRRSRGPAVGSWSHGHARAIRRARAPTAAAAAASLPGSATVASAAPRMTWMWRGHGGRSM